MEDDDEKKLLWFFVIVFGVIAGFFVSEHEEKNVQKCVHQTHVSYQQCKDYLYPEHNYHQ